MTEQSYKTGWDDGYAEGYGCKLADATEPFNPKSIGLPYAVERAADYIQKSLACTFGDDRPDAIGLARGIVQALQGPISKLPVSDLDREASADLAHRLGITAEQFTGGAADIIVQAFARHHVDGWSDDMDAAPKNTKLHLAYQDSLGYWRQIMGCYHTQLPWHEDAEPEGDEEYAPEGWYEESNTHEHIMLCASEPTHWRPLAPTPAMISAAKGEA